MNEINLGIEPNNYFLTSIPKLFDKICSQNPDSVAIIWWEDHKQSITFKQLYSLVGKTITAIEDHGLSRNKGAFIGVHCEKKPFLIAAIIALWHLDLVYVPVEKDLPDEYKKQLVKSSNLSAILCDGNEAATFTETTLISYEQVILYDEPNNLILDGCSLNSPAFLIYTSGSTNKPKGVVHSQRSVLNRLVWMWNNYPLNKNDIVSVLSRINVIPTIGDLFSGLLTGIATVMIPSSLIQSPQKMLKFLADNKITHITMVPSVLRILLNYQKNQLLVNNVNLRRVIVCGEILRHTDTIDFYSVFSNSLLLEDYGSTESYTIGFSERKIDGDHGFQAISNSNIEIRDENFNLVKCNTEGEVCVSSHSLALYYYNLPSITNQHFIEIKNSTINGYRIYRTGDYGYLDQHNKLILKGRRDNKVKINGQAVELSAIEEIISENQSINEVCVTCRETSHGNKQVIAWYTVNNGLTVNESILKSEISSKAPASMVPHRLICLKSLPKLANGKIDRAKLMTCSINDGTLDTVKISLSSLSSEEEVRCIIVNVTQSILQRKIGADEYHTNWVSLGFDSITIIELKEALSICLEQALDISDLYNYPNIYELSVSLINKVKKSSIFELTKERNKDFSIENDIAVIGIAGQFPGAESIPELWQLIINNQTSIKEIPSERWSLEQFYDSDSLQFDHSSSKWGGFLEEPFNFEAELYGVTPNEALYMDPQQRLCLYAVRQVMQDAGYSRSDLKDKPIGVFIGARQSEYLNVLKTNRQYKGASAFIGNDNAFLAGRISYLLGIHGPSFVLDTACSSSMVAIHMACSSIRYGEATMAFAGGVSLALDPDFFVKTSDLGVLSHTGECRPFDNESDGFVNGEGVAFILLKKLSQAITDKDQIYGVIKASAVNHDGQSNSITAPNGDSQANLYRNILEQSGIKSHTIGYIETHGTGTKLGDPIEANALLQVFDNEQRDQHCSIGSLKSNIGHLTSAAGVASLIKVLNIVKYGMIPPLKNFTKLNNYINPRFSDIFQIPTSLQKWNQPIRRACVSSFGLSGTNSACLVESWDPLPVKNDDSNTNEWQIILTASSIISLIHYLTDIASFLKQSDDSIASIAFTLAHREVESYGWAFSVVTIQDFENFLEIAIDKSKNINKGINLLEDSSYKLKFFAKQVENNGNSIIKKQFIGTDYRKITLPVSKDFGKKYKPYTSANKMRVDLNVGYQDKQVRGNNKQNIWVKILEIFKEVIGVEYDDSMSNQLLSNSGLDSLKSLSLQKIVYQKFSIKIDVFDMMSSMSFGKLIDLILNIDKDYSEASSNNYLDAQIHNQFNKKEFDLPLTDLQTNNLVCKLSSKGIDAVGSCVYSEILFPNLSVELLQKAWNKLTKLHPMLRTIIKIDGKQTVLKESEEYKIKYEDILLTGEDVELHIDKVFNSMLSNTSKPERYPLYEVFLSRIDAYNCILHLCIDASIVDAHSAKNLLQQLYMFYHDEHYYPIIPKYSFVEFIDYQAKLESTKEYKDSLSYWANKLSGDWEPAYLPRINEQKDLVTKEEQKLVTESTKTETETIPFFRLHKNLTKKLSENMKLFFKNLCITTSNGLFAVFLDWLSIYQKKNSFAIVMTLKNRPPIHPDIDLVVGPFSSSMVYIADVRKNQSFSSFAQNIQKNFYHDLEHSQVSSIKAMRINSISKKISIVYSGFQHTHNESSFSNYINEEQGIASGVKLHCKIIEKQELISLCWDIDQRFLSKEEATKLMVEFVSHFELIIKNEIDKNNEQINYLKFDGDSNKQVNIAPLTFLMQSYITQNHMNPDNLDSYVVRGYKVNELNKKRLINILNELETKHCALKTVINFRCQSYFERSSVFYPLLYINWNNVYPENIDAAFQESERRLISEMLKNRSQWPGYFIALMEYEGYFYLQFLFRSLFFDGFSIIKFSDEVIAKYNLSPIDKPQSEISFTASLDYAMMQQNMSKNSIGKVAENYWFNKMDTIFSENPIFSPSKTNSTNTLRHKIDGLDKLITLSHQQQVGLDVIIIYFFRAALPQKIQNQPILIVEYIHRRLKTGWASSLGDFSSFAVLSSESITFNQIQNSLEYDRANSFFNLFSISSKKSSLAFPLVFTNALDADLITSENNCVYCSSNTHGVMIDCFVYRQGNSLYIELTYSLNDIFAEITPVMFEKFKKLLENEISKDSKKQLYNNVIDPLELQIKLNQTKVDFNQENTMVSLFDKAVQNNNLNIATIEDNLAFTYRQLQFLSCHYAKYLNEKYHISNGDVVAVKMERNTQLFALLYGILRLGAIFVPLNENDSVDRQEKMLIRSKSTLLIGDRQFINSFNCSSIEKLYTESFLKWDELDSDFEIIDYSKSNTLAYIIFTSGSTGEPKGVMVKHRPVINLIEWMKEQYHFNHSDRVLWVNSIAFDLSIFDIFGFFSYGASVRILSSKHKKDALAIKKILSNEPITFWNSAPAYFQMIAPFLMKPDVVKKLNLRLIFFSGDWVPINLASQILEYFPNTQLVSLGGATEATVWSNYFNVTYIDANWNSIPYGKPIQNARYYILNDDKKPCNINEVGQLFISGDCLSEGYVNADDLTSKSFVSDPFQNDKNIRMYDTGDKARFLADGNIEFMGRADNQVKIRGYRVELSEIESVMSSIGFIEPIVLIDKSNLASPVLIGFFLAPLNMDLLLLSEYKNILKQSLPEYMIPDQFVSVLEYPITENGKIDRKELLLSLKNI